MHGDLTSIVFPRKDAVSTRKIHDRYLKVYIAFGVAWPLMWWFFPPTFLSFVFGLIVTTGGLALLALGTFWHFTRRMT